MTVVAPIGREERLRAGRDVLHRRRAGGAAGAVDEFWENGKADVFPASGDRAVDDTPVGIEAGRNAGMWTVGVARTGNEMGLTQAESMRCRARGVRRRLTDGPDRLSSSGAHYVIDGVADLLPVLDEIERAACRGGAAVIAKPQAVDLIVTQIASGLA